MVEVSVDAHDRAGPGVGEDPAVGVAGGEELAYDYQYEWRDDYTDDDVKLYVCKCGAKSCRGTILDPKSRKKR